MGENGRSQECLTWIHNGDWVGYKYVSFAREHSHVAFSTGSLTGGSTIEVRIDAPDGPLIASCTVPYTGGWQKWQTLIASVQMPIDGVHAVYLVFRGGQGRLLDLLDFTFR